MVAAAGEETPHSAEPAAGPQAPGGGPAGPAPADDPAAVLGELREVVLAYVRQEAVEPLKRLALWLAFGLAGGVFVSTGLVLLALAGLRALQTETGDRLAGSWSWSPYAIVLAGVLAVFLLARSAARARRRTPESSA